jgi:hypothetical protein
MEKGTTKAIKKGNKIKVHIKTKTGKNVLFEVKKINYRRLK